MRQLPATNEQEAQSSVGGAKEVAVSEEEAAEGTESSLHLTESMPVIGTSAPANLIFFFTTQFTCPVTLQNPKLPTNFEL